LAIVALTVFAWALRVTEGRLGALGAVENETAARAGAGVMAASATTDASARPAHRHRPERERAAVRASGAVDVLLN
jgi:hypothetical protein